MHLMYFMKSCCGLQCVYVSPIYVRLRQWQQVSLVQDNYLSIYLFTYLPVCLSVCLSVCLQFFLCNHFDMYVFVQFNSNVMLLSCCPSSSPGGVVTPQSLPQCPGFMSDPEAFSVFRALSLSLSLSHPFPIFSYPIYYSKTPKHHLKNVLVL